MTGSASTTDLTSVSSHPANRVAIGRRTLIWVGLVLADVVIWIVADSQGPDLFAFNAQGSFLNVLKVAWAVSFIGFFLLIAVGLVSVIRSRLRGRHSL
jgi:hypothetical protein